MILCADGTGERSKRRSEYLLNDTDFVEVGVKMCAAVFALSLEFFMNGIATVADSSSCGKL
jgi:hypothetical protein